MLHHLQIYLVDLEPFGDTSCVVVMPARQRYHGFTASESGQADRAAASKQTPENMISDAMEISLFVVNIRKNNNSHVVTYESIFMAEYICIFHTILKEQTCNNVN
jgi:hypothetical protein